MTERRDPQSARSTRGLGLPKHVDACLFDLDGVLTDTAAIHAAVWKETFDAFLRERAERAHTRFTPFDEAGEYARYVDGRTRLDGTRAFLRSRGITLPEGGPGDGPGAPTVNGLATRKNELLLRRVRAGHVRVYPGSEAYVRAARAAGLRVGVVSSSANCRELLKATGLDALVDAVVDGEDMTRDRLPGKPAPDGYLAGARAVDVPPGRCAVYEDALAGVAAGRAGRFGCVVGVDRTGQADALRAAGADLVVTDLADLLESA